MKRFILGALCVVALGCNTSTPTADNDRLNDDTNQVVDRDNTAVNARDRSSAATTPFDQKENQSDIDITAKIRSQVVGTDMSLNAQNVKIMTKDGNVTLRGPVATADEKLKIGRLANEVAGTQNVDNQLEVQP